MDNVGRDGDGDGGPARPLACSESLGRPKSNTLGCPDDGVLHGTAPSASNQVLALGQ